MLTNKDARLYSVANSHGNWSKFFSIEELIELHGLEGDVISILYEYEPLHLTRKELIANLSQTASIWIDGLSALNIAAVMSSPAVPSVTNVHVNLIPELVDKIELVEQRYSGRWDTVVSIHQVDRSDKAALLAAIPDDLDAANLVSHEITLPYIEAILEKLSVGGYVWLDDNLMAGRPMAKPDSTLAKVNSYLSDREDLTVHFSCDLMGYSLIRKNS